MAKETINYARKGTPFLRTLLLPQPEWNRLLPTAQCPYPASSRKATSQEFSDLRVFFVQQRTAHDIALKMTTTSMTDQYLKHNIMNTTPVTAAQVYQKTTQKITWQIRRNLPHSSCWVWPESFHGFHGSSEATLLLHQKDLCETTCKKQPNLR